MTTARYAGLETADQLEAALREIGAERYHILHPFHRLLHTGQLDRGQVQAWALNRYYYQSRIPMKDAALISRCADAALRREWQVRLLDHDGTGDQEGGIVRWLRLCEGLGLDPDYVRSEEGILPATKFAVDAYVHFVRDRTAAGGHRVVLDRAVRAQDPRGAHSRPAQALRLRHRGDGGLFPPPARSGTTGCGLRTGLCAPSRRHGREAPGRGECADLQVQRALGAARRVEPRLRAGRRGADRARSARRIPATRAAA